jgi:predicted permease
LACALRALRAAPLFTCVAAGTLALGIAFNAIIFSLVNSVLLDSLPYPDSDRLVVLQSRAPHGVEVQDLAAPTVFFVKQHATMLESVATLIPTDAGINLSGPVKPGYARALRVSADFFRTLRTTPLLGRTFDELDDRPGGARVAVLSYTLWRRTLGDRGSLGSGWRINGEEYTVIGVMPESFRSYPGADLWLPLQISPTQSDPGGNYRVIARIREGFTAQMAGEELRNLSQEDPSSSLPSQEHSVIVLQGLQRFVTQDVRQRLIFLMSAVFLVLLIACTNIEMLMLVRAVARSHEIGVRLALGSSRSRLIQLFFIEGAIISVLGGLFGVILANELLPILLFLSPPGLPLFAGIRVDWRVVEFTSGISVLTALLFGVAMAIRLSRLETNELMGATTVRVTAGAGQTWAARFILVVQTALTLILLSGSMLFLRHLFAVESIEPGFDTRHAAVAQVALVGRSYQTATGTARGLDGILKHVRALPSVEDSATISALPLEKGLNVPIRLEDAPKSIDSVEYRSISPDYFSVLRIPLIQGRLFSVMDGPETQNVAIVNETMAHKWWPTGSALGHFIAVGKELGPEFTDQRRQIVGVVADVHQLSLEQLARPTVFVPTPQVPDSIMAYTNHHFLTSIVIGTSNPAGISEQVRAAIESADPDLPVVSFRPLRQVVRNSTSRDRFYTSLTAMFGGFGLLITAVGLYGLLSYQIGLRAREIAVRISFGANRAHTVMLILRQSMRLVATGVAIGAAGSLFSIHLLVKLLYNPTSSIAWSALAGGAMLLGLVAILASLLAAIQIVSVDPMFLLRNEQ